MDYEMLTLSFDGPVALLTLSRPPVNALNARVLDDLSAALAEVAAHPDARALVLTGAGTKAFVAGADIAAMSNMTQAEAEAFSRAGQAVFDAIEALPVPVVAAVNGFALGGGCELVLACDIVYAAENAIFGQPEVNLGIIPGFGGTARLVRVIGRNSALEWILAGQNFSAQEAWRLGLVQKVLSASELLPAAMALATTLASRGPIAVRAARRLVRAAQDVPLGAALDSEVKAFADLFDSDDRKEGMTAFLERRAPAFKGR